MLPIATRSGFPEDESFAADLAPEIMAELEEAARYAAAGVRDREVMRRACESMDRTRKEIFRRCGLLDFAVPTIRELRNGDEQ